MKTLEIDSTTEYDMWWFETVSARTIDGSLSIVDLANEIK